jgi:hypothetical protein
VFLQHQSRLYYGGSDYYHYGWRSGNLSLATLRPDGFAGYEQKSEAKPAMIVTKPIDLSSTTLQVSADVQTNGEVKVTITDVHDNPLATAVTIRKTVTDQPIELLIPSANDAESQKIKLRFEIQDAKLYSFGFNL